MKVAEYAERRFSMKKHCTFLGAIFIFIIILLILVSRIICYRPTLSFTDEISEYINKHDVNSKEPSILKKAVIKSQRKNILILGIERQSRTDAIIFLSVDPKFNSIDIISIPRDTYYYEKGYDRGDQRKINAAYGRSKEKGSIEAVGKILGGVIIHNYVSIEYKGVEEIVDALGGIEVEVPCHMEVGGMEIEEGFQRLNGKQALQFLRFRKEYRDGDLGRIKVQQNFIDKVINKFFSSNFLEIIKKSYVAVKTDIPLEEIISYAVQIKEVKDENISMVILPGKAKYKEIGGKNWSFYFHDPTKTKELINKIFYVNKKNILEFE